MASKTPILIVTVAVIGASVWGGKSWLYSRDHVVTDNAQIDGPMMPAASKLQAFATQVRVVDNQVVKAGDTLVVLDGRDLDAKIAQTKADLASAIAMAGSPQHAGQLAAQVDWARATAAGAQATVSSAETRT